MARRTREEIQKEVAEAKAAREKAYFEAQAKAKAGAAALAPDLPAADAYRYSYSWKQDPGAPTGELTLIKNPNQYYDSSTNTIVDPATGERTPVIQSMWSGPTTFRAGGPVVTDSNAKDPVTGLTQAQKEAADALAKAKADSAALAAALGAQIDPNTGKIIPSTIDPTKAAAWYASQSSSSTNTGFKITDGKLYNNGQLFSGTYNGKVYENGVLKTSTSSDNSSSGSTVTSDPATLALIKSLQDQIAALSGNVSQQNAAAAAATAQAKIDAAVAAEAAKKEKAENAITVLTSRFSRYGLASLVPKIRELAIAGASESTITLQLQETEEYKTRFKANQDRIKKGLRVLEPSDYLNLEDDYRQILRAYGLRQFDTDAYVQQFISNDISTTELSNRVVTAVQRVQNADPAILATLRGYYGISDNDLVAYVLDPNQQFQKIERQVAAAEIGAAAGLQGLQAGVSVAEQLAAQGITKAQAQKGYATIADILPTAEKLSDIYKGTEDEYRQAEAEQEVFNTLASAQRKRTKLAQRELAAFSGSTGLGKSSLMQQVGGTF